MTDAVHRFGRFHLDLARRELRQDTTVVPLQPQVFALLTYLVQHRDRVVPVSWVVGARDTVHDEVLRAGALTADATVRVVARADHFQTFASAAFADAVAGLAARKPWS